MKIEFQTINLRLSILPIIRHKKSLAVTNDTVKSDQQNNWGYCSVGKDNISQYLF